MGGSAGAPAEAAPAAAATGPAAAVPALEDDDAPFAADGESAEAAAAAPGGALTQLPRDVRHLLKQLLASDDKRACR